MTRTHRATTVGNNYITVDLPTDWGGGTPVVVVDMTDAPQGLWSTEFNRVIGSDGEYMDCTSQHDSSALAEHIAALLNSVTRPVRPDTADNETDNTVKLRLRSDSERRAYRAGFRRGVKWTHTDDDGNPIMPFGFGNETDP